MSALTTPIQHHSRSLTNAVRQQKGIHYIHIGKEEIKLSLFTDDTTVYVENLKKSTKISLELKNNYSTIEGYKGLSSERREKSVLRIKKKVTQKDLVKKESSQMRQKKGIAG